MDAVVRKLLVALLAALAIAVAVPAGVAVAQPETAEQTEQDLYAECRALGDGVANAIGSVFLERGCDVFKAVTNPSDAAGEFASGTWDTMVGEAAQVFAEGWKEAITFMMTWWMTNSVSGPLGNSNTESLVYVLHQYLRVIQILVFFAAIVTSMIKLAWAKHHMMAAHATEAAQVLTRSVFATWALTPIVILADEGSRGLGVWLIERMVGDNIDGALDKLLTANQLGTLGAGLVFVLALLGIVGTIIQAVFIMVQIALARLVLGFAPVAAAASGLGNAGRQVWAKVSSWCVVLVLFPLVASVVYGIAFTSISYEDESGQGVLAGMILLSLSFLVAPTLARLIVPTMSGMAGGSAAPAVSAATVGSGAVAAKGMSSMGSSASRGGATTSTNSVAGGRSQGPTGAVSTGGGSSIGGSGAATGVAKGAGAGSGAAAAAGPAGIAVVAGQAVAKGAKAVGNQVAGAAESGASAGEDPSGSMRGGRST
ncbi:hypothetical protein [Rhodococcus wratislaviensis]|uniref:hypothetical protein n=1 Tax=Rhodococcus wratislaviensis TaxID=44752 RepID=UPI00365B8EDC